MKTKLASLSVSPSWQDLATYEANKEKDMIAYRLSTLELRSIVESAFLPMRCTCSVSQDSCMTVQIVDPHSDRVELLVTGISLDRLNTPREISELVAELRYDLAHTRHHHGKGRIAV